MITALAELLSVDLPGLDLVAMMIDGAHFAESSVGTQDQNDYCNTGLG